MDWPEITTTIEQSCIGFTVYAHLLSVRDMNLWLLREFDQCEMLAYSFKY